MTAQEIFETVVKALALQGERSYYPDQGCFYRHPEGLKCAVGHLIPDEEYDQCMEGSAVSSIIHIAGSDSFLSSLEPHIELLSRLQIAHDLSTTWETRKIFIDTFREISALFYLDSSFMDDLVFGGPLADMP
jgi:hypothetical protein